MNPFEEADAILAAEQDEARRRLAAMEQFDPDRIVRRKPQYSSLYHRDADSNRPVGYMTAEEARIEQLLERLKSAAAR